MTPFPSIDGDDMSIAMRWANDAAGQLIDPHTAGGLAAARLSDVDPAIPMVTLATAHPAKFPDAVERATGLRPQLPARISNLFERDESYDRLPATFDAVSAYIAERRSEEHTSELQSLMRISYAVFCLKKKNAQLQTQHTSTHKRN